MAIIKLLLTLIEFGTRYFLVFYNVVGCCEFLPLFFSVIGKPPDYYLNCHCPFIVSFAILQNPSLYIKYLTPAPPSPYNMLPPPHSTLILHLSPFQPLIPLQNSALLTVETPPKITLDPADMQQWGGNDISQSSQPLPLFYFANLHCQMSLSELRIPLESRQNN